MTPEEDRAHHKQVTEACRSLHGIACEEPFTWFAFVAMSRIYAARQGWRVRPNGYLETKQPLEHIKLLVDGRPWARDVAQLAEGYAALVEQLVPVLRPAKPEASNEKRFAWVVRLLHLKVPKGYGLVVDSLSRSAAKANDLSKVQDFEEQMRTSRSAIAVLRWRVWVGLRGRQLESNIPAEALEQLHDALSGINLGAELYALRESAGEVPRLMTTAFEQREVRPIRPGRPAWQYVAAFLSVVCPYVGTYSPMTDDRWFFAGRQWSSLSVSPDAASNMRSPLSSTPLGLAAWLAEVRSPLVMNDLIADLVVSRENYHSGGE